MLFGLHRSRVSGEAAMADLADLSYVVDTVDKVTRYSFIHYVTDHHVHVDPSTDASLPHFLLPYPLYRYSPSCPLAKH